MKRGYGATAGSKILTHTRFNIDTFFFERKEEKSSVLFHHVSPKFSNSPDDSPDQTLNRIKI